MGRSLSLISQTEAKKYGGTSDISDKQAEEVGHLELIFPIFQLTRLCSLWLEFRYCWDLGFSLDCGHESIAIGCFLVLNILGRDEITFF